MKWEKNSDMLNNIDEYIDFDFAEFKIYKKLTKDYVFILVSSIISYLLRLEWIFILLICEVKYMTMCKAEKKAIYLKYLLAKLWFEKKSIRVILYAEN